MSFLNVLWSRTGGAGGGEVRRAGRLAGGKEEMRREGRFVRYWVVMLRPVGGCRSVGGRVVQLGRAGGMKSAEGWSSVVGGIVVHCRVERGVRQPMGSAAVYVARVRVALREQQQGEEPQGRVSGYVTMLAEI